MGATLTGKTAPRARHGLIALIAIRQARAMHDRREKDEAERAASTAAKTEARSKKRGWFR